VFRIFHGEKYKVKPRVIEKRIKRVRKELYRLEKCEK